MMNLLEACLPVAHARPNNAIVVATMGAMFALDQIDAKAGQRLPGRISSVPLMGGAAGLGLGLALAHPGRPVIVVDGDASLLMELGGMASVVAAQPALFLHIVIANGTQFSGLANLSTLERARPVMRTRRLSVMQVNGKKVSPVSRNCAARYWCSCRWSRYRRARSMALLCPRCPICNSSAWARRSRRCANGLRWLYER